MIAADTRPWRLFGKKVITNSDDPNNPYMIRWIIFRCPLFAVLLHKICRSDHDRALHDHPWTFLSIILRNGYTEHTPSGAKPYGVGAVLYRPATWRHRVQLKPGKPAWTLVLTSGYKRTWGFWKDGRFCPWFKYDSTNGWCEE